MNRRTMLLGSCVAGIAAPRKMSDRRAAALPGEDRADGGTASVEDIEGWRVYVEPSAALEAAHCREALLMVRCQLYQIDRGLPPRAVECLRQVGVHVGADRLPAAHEPCAELGEARAFLAAARDQPWALLHALALAHCRARLEGGGFAAELAAAHAAAVESGKYRRVLGADGRRRRHPCLAGAAEYFAAATTALFGTSDSYPFVRAQLREADPHAYQLVWNCWMRQAGRRLDLSDLSG